MTHYAGLVDHFKDRLTDALELLRNLVEIESHSCDKEGVDSLVLFLRERFSAPGVSIQIIEEDRRGNHLLVKWPGKRSRKPILLLGHLDTVWPRGTLRERPFRLEGNSAHGPGVFDMKCGLLLYLLAFDSFRLKDFDPERTVYALLVSDEEIGTAAGLPHLQRIAPECAAVLCAEPPLPGGRVKTARSGVGTMKIRVSGVQSHAGVDYVSGASAILELSRLTVRLHELTQLEHGILLNVGTIKGGIASNVISGAAEAELDFRFKAVADGAWIEKTVRSMKAADPRCTIIYEGGVNRPPLERGPGVARLYEKARSLAMEMGSDLGEGETGGGSDGSFTAAMGIPTLDGLGVDGGGAHAVNEHVIISGIPHRAALLCGLIAEIE